MSDSTTELGLQLAVGGDDTADYLTIRLRQSLQSIDGTYNQASGHTHSGPHQGGLIASAAFGGPFDLPDWFRSTGQRSGFATSGQGLEMYWSGVAGVVQSYDRGANQYRDLMLEGATIHLARSGTDALVIDGSSNVNIANSLTVTGTLNATGQTTLHATQVIGTLTSSGLQVNGNGAVTGTLNVSGTSNLGVISAASQTLTSTLTVTGATTLNATQVNGTLAVSGATTVQSGNAVPYTVGATQEHIEHGTATLSGVGNNSAATLNRVFARAFAGVPVVTVALGTPTSGDLNSWHVGAQNVTTSGFDLRAHNSSGSTGNITVFWTAIGA